ncbi:hypothetical protein [Microbacterium oleivorans]|uniref:Uncharacterized protein n=1 Tax=Microbacterium oleivorans TaxID=273677 RepID=A0A7D5J0N8_9MICO|nr:hypothetical protein [Microbacterium oleivorans]QLD12895.1 hypothetical protein HW566_14585 [Microbacterium oleivorans]
MPSHHRASPSARAQDAWRIAAVVSAVLGSGCLALLLPTLFAALRPEDGLGAAGLFALPVIPTAPLCAVVALAVGAVSAVHRDVVGVSFSAAGLVSASLATTIVTALGGYGILAWLWEAAVVTEVSDAVRRLRR